MKSSELRKMIREEVKNALHEELKDLLLEVIKSSPRTQPTPNVALEESKHPSGEYITPTIPNKPTPDLRTSYESILQETQQGIGNNGFTGDFVPGAEGAELGQGSVGMDQIEKLING